MTKKIEVSVIIATKDEEKNLPRLLNSLHKQTFQNFEIIIVDNFSKDTTLQIARSATPKIYTHGTERSSQRNFGATKALGSYLLFLDADMELPPKIIKECLHTIETHQKLIALIIPETVPGTHFFARIKQLEKRLYENFDLIEAPRFIKKRTFINAQGYTKHLIAGEDWDLRLKLETYGTIGRIKNHLLHYETSLIRELSHKWYYGKNIRNYARLNPVHYKQQRGFARIRLFIEKRTILYHYPVAAVGLIMLKIVEFIIFCFAHLYGKKKN